MEDSGIVEEKKGITFKAIIWFLIALAACGAYYFMINVGLMKVQGLDFFYLWSSGAPAAGGH